MINIERIKQALSQYNVPAMLVTSPEGRLFATGFSSSAGALVVSEKGAWFITDARYFEMAEAAITGDVNVLLATKDERVSEKVKAILNENGITSVGFEDGTLSFAAHKDWHESLEIEMIPCQKLVSDLRAIKSRADLDKMIAAQRLSEKVFEEILPLINTNMTEKELAAEIIYRSLRHGADDKSFNPIVVSGPKSSLPHGVPGDEKIGKGFLTIDFGVKLDGWCSDTTRTLCIGKPDDEMVKIYETVLKAQLAGIAAIRAGVAGKVVDAAARNVITDAGYGEYFGHGFGHAMGIEVHEPPSASPLSKDILQAGTVISAEPGIYLPGRYGVRIEDIVYVTDNGCENITNLAKELLIL